MTAIPKKDLMRNLTEYRRSLGLFPFSGWTFSKEEAQRLSKKYKGPLLREQPKDYEEIK